MKIKTDYEGCPYITAGKGYEASREGSYLKIVDDEGDTILVKIESCAHLGSHGWQVVQEERFSQEVAQEMYELLESLRENYGMSSAVGKEIDTLLAKARGE